MILIFVRLDSNLGIWKPVLSRVTGLSAIGRVTLDDQEMGRCHVWIHPQTAGGSAIELLSDLQILYQRLDENKSDLAIVNLSLLDSESARVLDDLAALQPKCVYHKGNFTDWKLKAAQIFRNCDCKAYTTALDDPGYDEYEQVLGALDIRDTSTMTRLIHGFNTSLASVRLLLQAAAEAPAVLDDRKIATDIERGLRQAYFALTAKAEVYLTESQGNELLTRASDILTLTTDFLDPHTSPDAKKRLELEARLDAWFRWVEDNRLRSLWQIKKTGF